MTLAAVSLDDKYALEEGRVFLTGTQALVRLAFEQQRRDAAAGLDTAGFISGYRGSPLGGYDIELWRAKEFLARHHIHFEPGVNEDLAATAVWGSQQVGLYAGARHDGVFGIWYGKAPGLDRSMDAMRHASSAGTAPHGGVLALVGDDHGAASSTLAGQSEHAFQSLMMPVLHPASVQEYIDFGLFGFAMSRFSGAWVGFKCLTQTVESSASIAVGPDRLDFTVPDDFEMPPGGLNIRLREERHDAEIRQHLYTVYAALSFARANAIDRVAIDSARPRLGILTAGKSYLDVRQALDDLGIDAATAAEIGLRIYKAGMVWPLERSGVRAFAEGIEEILVVEEKRAVMENQLREQLYNWPDAVRPRVVGKFDEDDRWLLPSAGEHTPAMVARVIAARINRFHTVPAITERLAEIEAKERSLAAAPHVIERMPYFCSGCPHNTSTKVPAGSRASAGIGCHWMALYMNRGTETFTHMGGEGAVWIGQAPFTDEGHVFVNLGDGTYHHSGLLAIRAAVEAGVTVTYKILVNDAVAMTGGQPQTTTLQQIAAQVLAEGVAKVVAVADHPEKYGRRPGYPKGVAVHPRDDLDHVQRTLRETEGVTVVVYDQTCAAKLRRRRKRGTTPDPDIRVFINEDVCEGCGDCSVKSNCVSVEPLETELGRKRVINQSSCNKDMSCIEGFCPSFVTLSGVAPRKVAAGVDELDEIAAGLPAPERPSIEAPYDILVTGIGGTGVITIGALIGMAAHMEGLGVTVLDQTGLSQKNGAVMSHIRIAADPASIHAVKLAAGRASLVLGCDAVVAASPDALAKIGSGATRAVVNRHLAPTAAFTLDPDAEFDGETLFDVIRDAAGANLTELVDATRIATALMGDAIATNLFMVGYAAQRGLIPVSVAAIERAVELNGVAVEANKRALAWGRAQAVDPDRVERIAAPALVPRRDARPERSLDEIIERRVELLTAYQGPAYARRYRDLVGVAERAEAERGKGLTGWAEAVAVNAARLMAYKDEYEVARLYTDGAFRARLEAQFEGDLSPRVHLAPPLLSRPDPATGEPRKRAFGPWVFTLFKVLARFKGVRGGPLDVFARTAERRAERRLIEDYFDTVHEIAETLSPETHAFAVQLARLPEKIRGFGPVKMRSIEAAERERTALQSTLRSPETPASAAE